MDERTCIEVFGNIIFSFTRSVSEKYNQRTLKIVKKPVNTVFWRIQAENGTLNQWTRLFIRNTAIKR